MWFLMDDNRMHASMDDLQEHPKWVSRNCKPPRSYLVPGTTLRRFYRPEADPTGRQWTTGTPPGRTTMLPAISMHGRPRRTA